MSNKSLLMILATLLALSMAQKHETFRELQRNLKDLKGNISAFTFDNETVQVYIPGSWKNKSQLCECEATFVKLLNDTLNILKCNSSRCNTTVGKIRNNLLQLKAEEEKPNLEKCPPSWRRNPQTYKSKIISSFVTYTEKWFSKC